MCSPPHERERDRERERQRDRERESMGMGFVCYVCVLVKDPTSVGGGMVVVGDGGGGGVLENRPGRILSKFHPLKQLLLI